MLAEAAFEAYLKHDTELHNRILLDEIDKLSKEVDVIVMAQLSMSVLAPEIKGVAVPVLNSGDTGFVRVREMLMNC